MTNALEPALPSEYTDAFQETWAEDAPPGDVRFVVLDCETTGLDPRRDRLISIGAVAIAGGEIVLEDSFEALLKIDHNLSAVTVHGITRDQARGGLDEPEALVSFLRYLRDGVIVGHHIAHDISTIDVALGRHFGSALRNRRIDTMDLTLRLEAAGALGRQASGAGFSLDSLCELFEVTPYDRHTATGDALLTALIFLKLLRMGERSGIRGLGELGEPAAGPVPS